MGGPTSDDVGVFFDDSHIHEIRIYFDKRLIGD